MNEIIIFTRLRHCNLVSLYDSLYNCTSYNSRESILIYGFSANSTAVDHPHDDQANPHALLWPLRVNVAIETANVLVSLHASDLIHRDVKTNNILSDHSFHVKVADFRLFRLFPAVVTHLSTVLQGTLVMLILNIISVISLRISLMFIVFGSCLYS